MLLNYLEQYLENKYRDIFRRCYAMVTLWLRTAVVTLRPRYNLYRTIAKLIGGYHSYMLSQDNAGFTSSHQILSWGD